jgi:hypothetical protein
MKEVLEAWEAIAVSARLEKLATTSLIVLKALGSIGSHGDFNEPATYSTLVDCEVQGARS